MGVQDWLPDCSSHMEAGPWCNRCRQCWAAELLLGEQAKCWKNQGCDFGSWGPGLKTEWRPSNFRTIQNQASAWQSRGLSQDEAMSLLWWQVWQACRDGSPRKCEGLS